MAFHQAEYLPPQHPLLPLETFRRSQGLGNGVVLARETAHEQVDASRERLDGGDVFVGVACCAEPRDVHVRRVLGLSGGLPLVGKSGLPARFREPQPEPAHTSKQLGNVPYDLGRFAEPFGRPHQIESVFQIGGVTESL